MNEEGLNFAPVANKSGVSAERVRVFEDPLARWANIILLGATDRRGRPQGAVSFPGVPTAPLGSYERGQLETSGYRRPGLPNASRKAVLVPTAGCHITFGCLSLIHI